MKNNGLQCTAIIWNKNLRSFSQKNLILSSNLWLLIGDIGILGNLKADLVYSSRRGVLLLYEGLFLKGKSSPFNVCNNWDMINLSYCEAGCKLDHFCEFHLQVYESTSADSGRHSETWGKTPRPRIHLVLPQLVQWSWQLMDCFSFPCKWSRTGGKHVVLCYKRKNRYTERVSSHFYKHI